MSNLKDFDVKIERMIELLTQGGQLAWADNFIRIKQNLKFNLADSKRKILLMYGGMGSLNDVILYANGIALISENNEFFDLKSDLYEMCYD